MKRKISILACILGTGFVVMTSCNKSDVASDLHTNGLAIAQQHLPGVGDSANFEVANTKGYLKNLGGGVYGARNFTQGNVPDNADTTQWATASGTYFYSLGNNDGVSGADTASNYDFKFKGTATADLVVNTGRYTLRYSSTAFASVASASTGTAISNGTSGWYVALVSPGGWYNYNILNHVVSARNPFTLILQSKDETKWHSYKIHINSIYKNGTPNASYAPNNYPFFSFDYAQL